MMLRNVVETYLGTGKGGAIFTELTLDCGHVALRTGHVQPPRIRVLCHACSAQVAEQSARFTGERYETAGHERGRSRS